MDQWYYINQQGTQEGPFQLQQLYGRGITAHTHVWQAGMPNWLPAGDVPAMGPILNAQPPVGGPPTNAPSGQFAHANPSMNPAMQPGYHPPAYANYQQPGQAIYHDSYTMKDLPSAEQVQQKFRVFSIFYWIQIVLWCATVVCFIVVEETSYYSYDYYTDDYTYNPDYEIYLMLSWIVACSALIATVISVVFRMQIVFFGFKAITDKYFRPRSTPGNAVGLLFVPLYYIYQRFISYKGLGEEMNRYIMYRSFKPYGVNVNTLQGLCIVGIISVVPYLGSLGWLVMIPFRFLAIKELKNGLIHILQERTMQDEI